MKSAASFLMTLRTYGAISERVNTAARGNSERLPSGESAMTDKAREILAAEYDRAGERETAKWLRGGGSKIDDINIRAINAALRTTPEGWVMVPEVMTLDMSIAFAEVWYSKRRAIDDHDMQDAYAAMLAAAQK